MGCAFYEFRSGLFDNNYCMKKQDYVSEDIYRKYCRGYYYDECPIYKHEDNSGGCYLTTACVEHQGLADNCIELETLRSFRDGYLKKSEQGGNEIDEYYRTAPTIVKAIDDSGNADDVYASLYSDVILPCVELIKDGNNEEAHKQYKEMVMSMKDKYCL